MRGTAASIVQLSNLGGSPPRVRGTEDLPIEGVEKLGITPACAGNSTRLLFFSLPTQDHPRVCGEQFGAHVVGNIGVGSPPRVRGTGDDARVNSIFNRITPACAGNRFLFHIHNRLYTDHPRVCGEQSSSLDCIGGIMGSPPRVRGTGGRRGGRGAAGRITPACAGNRQGNYARIQRG